VTRACIFSAVHTYNHSMHVNRHLAVLGLVGAPAVAFAQGATLDASTTDGATASVDGASAAGQPTGPDQLTMPKGKLLVNAFVEINLSTDAAFKPVSISPDLWYGVTDDLTLGLVHSSIGASGVIGAAGDALCITGSSNGCESVYPGLGIDARYRLKGAWAVDGGLFVNDFDPFALALKLGVAGRLRVGEKVALDLQPSLFIGLTERDTNKEVLAIPVTAGFAVMPQLTAYVQLAFITPFESAGELWLLAASLGARYRVSDHLDLGLAFSLPALAGGGDGTGVDARTVTLGVSYAL
jgi:hypothetical protein